MPNDPYYRTRDWQALCEIVRRRSGGICEVPACDRPGKVVDHVTSRRNGGADTAENLRHLCRSHDNEIKENASGKRRSGGVLSLPGCDADGQPLDPGHWWNKQ